MPVDLTVHSRTQAAHRIFTQEDPIGLAGGLNLYGFAGGDPVNFSDPFGLYIVDDEADDPKCPECEKVAKFKIGPRLGLKYGAKLGAIKGELSVGAEAAVGVKQDVVGGEVDNSGVASAQVGVGIKLTAFGVGVDEFIGFQAGDEREPVKSTPVEADGTVGFTGTIPLVWAGPVPIGGPQVSFELNVPAALRRIRDGISSLFQRR